MVEPAITTSASDGRIEGELNEFIYALYRRAHGAETRAPGAGSTVADAGQIDAILRAPDRFQKNLSLVALLGRSRFGTNGEEWGRRRDLTQREYSRAGAATNRGRMASVYADAFAQCDIADPRSVPAALLAASSKIFLSALGLGSATASLLNLFESARNTIKRLQYYSWFGPGAEALSGLRTQAELLLARLEGEVARLKGGSEFLSGLQSRGADILNFQAREEFLMNFLAGTETTAAALSFAIDRLGIDPRVQERLFAEVDAAECPYLECFLNETLRYFPAIPFVVREVADDTVVDGVAFRKGQIVVLSIVGVHHDRRYWQEPEIFDCSRAEFLRDTYDRRAFIPFLAGPRMCAGARLARLELTEGFKAFIRRFIVRRDGDEIKFDYGVALRPNSWDRINMSMRR